MKKYHWIYRRDTDRNLIPDPALLLDRGEIIKQNPFRTVRKTVWNDQTFFVKYDTPCTMKKILRECVFPKTKKEFLTAQTLESMQIPCVEYPVYGRAGANSVLISPALNGYVSMTEYIYTHPLTECFLHALVSLVRLLMKNHVEHPDFHSGNLMVDPEHPDKLCLIDLNGIRITHSQPSPLRNGHILTDLSAFISAEQGEKLFREAGLDGALWHVELARTMKRLERTWKRRIPQILSGNSKFAKTQIIDGEPYIIRTTSWFSLPSFSAKDKDIRDLPQSEGLALWLESFRREQFRELPEGPRIAAIRLQDDRVFLYCEKETEK